MHYNAETSGHETDVLRVRVVSPAKPQRAHQALTQRSLGCRLLRHAAQCKSTRQRDARGRIFAAYWRLGVILAGEVASKNGAMKHPRRNEIGMILALAFVGCAEIQSADENCDVTPPRLTNLLISPLRSPECKAAHV